jgi:hypothetical protein
MLRESPESNGTLETALALHRRCVRLIPLAGKKAIVKEWPTLHLSENDIRDWSRRGMNFGIITGSPLVVLDTDTDEAEAWVKAKGIDSPVVVRSGRGGFHRYFRSPEHEEVRSRTRIHKIDGLDLRGWRSYIVAAGSVHPETGRRYEYLPGRELTDLHLLPVFDPAWTKEIQPQAPRAPNAGAAPVRLAGRIRDVRAYIRAIPSVEGSGGDRACFRVACVLAQAGFDYGSALAEMEDWNQTCAFPPWSRKELEHKVQCAIRRVMGGDEVEYKAES